MKGSVGLLAFLGSMLLLAAMAFFAIAITTGNFVRSKGDDTGTVEAVQVVSTQVVSTVESTPDPSVEINFVFCHKPTDGVELSAATCNPALIREDTKVSVQVANGAPIAIDGFDEVRTGFKIILDSGDTVIALSIENPYFDPVTFGGPALNLENVTEPQTVYLSI